MEIEISSEFDIVGIEVEPCFKYLSGSKSERFGSGILDADFSSCPDSSIRESLIGASGSKIHSAYLSDIRHSSFRIDVHVSSHVS